MAGLVPAINVLSHWPKDVDANTRLVLVPGAAEPKCRAMTLNYCVLT